MTLPLQKKGGGGVTNFTILDMNTQASLKVSELRFNRFNRGKVAWYQQKKVGTRLCSVGSALCTPATGVPGGANLCAA